MVYFVKLLEDKYDMISINTQFEGVLEFSGIFDLVCLFIVDIWHEFYKGSVSTLISNIFSDAIIVFNK